MPTGFFFDQAPAMRQPPAMPELFPAKKKRPPPVDVNESLGNVVRQLREYPKSHLFVGFSQMTDVDLRTVEEKTKRGEYAAAGEFAADMRKMFNIAFQTYTPGSMEYQATVELSDKFERLLPRSDRPSRSDSHHKSHREPTKERKPRPPAKPMTHHQKQILAEQIMKLDKQYLSQVIEIVSGHNRKAAGDKFEFDIDKLPPEVCRELKNYVRRCKRKTNPETQRPKTEGKPRARPRKPTETKGMVLESDSSSSSCSSSGSSSDTSSASEAEGDNNDLSRIISSK